MATAATEIKVTPEIAAEHGVTRDEYARIQQILGRDPNITELGIFSVMWSEHCSYKSSKVHLKRLPTRGKLVVQGPGENAGVVDIGDGLVAAFKIESHNHPSYVEPFQGATTGVGGILRDIFTMGARPIAVLDSLRFGEITPGKNTTAEDAARDRRILDGVVRGVGGYGNCFGVPTVGGEVAFEPCYSQNPLVNALALGIAKKKKFFSPKPKALAIPSSMSAQKPAVTEFTAHRCWPPPNSPKSRNRNAPTCKSAIPSWRNCSSKPASKPCRLARSSRFRIWAPLASPAPPWKWLLAAAPASKSISPKSPSAKRA